MVQQNRETAFTVRCDLDLKEKAEALAKEKGQSLVEWVRRAMKEQIERESNPQKQTFRDMDELQAYVEKAVDKAIENKLKSD